MLKSIIQKTDNRAELFLRNIIFEKYYLKILKLINIICRIIYYELFK